MYQDSKRTCKAAVLLTKPFVWWRSRCRRRHGLLKLSNVHTSLTTDMLFCRYDWTRWVWHAACVCECPWMLLENCAHLHVSFSYLLKIDWFTPLTVVYSFAWWSRSNFFFLKETKCFISFRNSCFLILWWPIGLSSLYVILPQTPPDPIGL